MGRELAPGQGAGDMLAAMLCAQCGHANPPHAQACERCGAGLARETAPGHGSPSQFPATAAHPQGMGAPVSQPPPPDAGLPTDAGTDAGPPVRVACEDLTDCPERPCEIAAACSDEGFCAYEPFVCASPGGTCPVLVCQAHSGTAGELVNTCVEMPGAACGEGGACSGTRCVVPTTGLRLVEGGLRAGSVGGTVRGAGGRVFALDGHLGFITSRGAPRTSGRLRMTGGVRP